MPTNKELKQKVKDLEDKVMLLEKISDLESRLRALENPSTPTWIGNYPSYTFTDTTTGTFLNNATCETTGFAIATNI